LFNFIGTFQIHNQLIHTRSTRALQIQESTSTLRFNLFFKRECKYVGARLYVCVYVCSDRVVLSSGPDLI